MTDDTPDTQAHRMVAEALRELDRILAAPEDQLNGQAFDDLTTLRDTLLRGLAGSAERVEALERPSQRGEGS